MSAQELIASMRGTPSSAKSKVKALANQFEEELLGRASFPDDYFAVLIEVISIPELFQKSGVWHFVLNVYHDRQKLSPGQLHRLLETFVRNYQDYRDEDLCLVVCDFVARGYSGAVALGAFEKMKSNPSRAGQVAVQVGLETVLANTPLSSPLASSVRELHSTIEAEKSAQ